MLIYRQKSGELLRDSPAGMVLLTTGYSGAPGPTKNNPLAQHQSNLGPLPAGVYWVGEPHDTEEHGPFVLPLVPVTGTELFGRSGFLIHGDSIQRPGTASHGCIIIGRPFREQIAAHGDKLLAVVSGA
jgi:hypothetical protein